MEDKRCTFCESLPKVELHAHLGGSIRNATLRELLVAGGYPNADELAAKCIIHGVDTNRTPSEQFEMFDIIGKAWQNEQITKRITKEFIEDAVKQNVIYTELRTGGSSREKLETILDTIDECSKQYSTVVKLVVSVKREWDLGTAREAVKMAADLKNRGVVGLDFCGNATCGSFTPFKEVFLEATNQGLPITCHFAETKDEQDLLDILSINPSRLGHACYLDPTTKNEIKARHLPIEACFASNINTMKLFSGISEHPFMKEWWKNGFDIIPCTDNYGILESYLSDHYHMIHELNATEEELWEMAEKSVRFIFAGEDVKQKLREIYNNHPLNPKNKPKE